MTGWAPAASQSVGEEPFQAGNERRSSIGRAGEAGGCVWQRGRRSGMERETARALVGLATSSKACRPGATGPGQNTEQSTYMGDPAPHGVVGFSPRIRGTVRPASGGAAAPRLAMSSARPNDKYRPSFDGFRLVQTV